MRTGLVFAVLAIGGAMAANTYAESYPSKPIEVVVPSSAGGASDITARLFQKALEPLLPQPVVIVNVPGAGTALGDHKVAVSEPDGYTVLMMHQAMISAAAQGAFKEGVESLEPVAATGEEANTIAVNAKARFKTLGELYDSAKKEPGSVVTAVGIGGFAHFTSIIAGQAGGVEFRPVNYKGGADYLKALLGGHVDVIFTNPSDTWPYQQSGDLRILAVMTKSRMDAMPDIPTAVEQGYPAFSSLNHMWWVPKGTPADRKKVLADALEKAMQDPDIAKKFKARLTNPVFMRGAELEAHVKAETKTIFGIVESLGLNKAK